MDFTSLLTVQNLIIAGSLIILIMGAHLLTVLIKKRNFKKKLLRLIDEPELMETDFALNFRDSQLRIRAGQIEKIADKTDPALIDRCGANDFWLQSLKKRRNMKLYKRVLKYTRGDGLFTCFLIALTHKPYASVFLKWFSADEDFLRLRRLALSGVGEEFSGEQALQFFSDHLPLMREMTGDPEWASRYFAIKILLYDSDDQSTRAIWESIHDPHPLIRKTICREFSVENREKFYNELFKLYLTDPVLEVRATAKERINRDFTDIYSINIDNLDTPQALHALEHLSAFSKADEDTALRFLDHDNLELRFAAARFLEERGALNRLMDQADLGDREELKRIENLLKKSCEVHISSFLNTAASSSKTGTFYIAVDILTEQGDIALIDPLCSKIFNLPQTTVENKDLFDRALLCIRKRGGDKALIHLKDLLLKYKNDKEYVVKILSVLPERGATFFVPELLKFLDDPAFPAREALREALIRMPSDLYIQKMLTIIRSGREMYPHEVRKDALKILVNLKQSFCLQTIMENLPILPNKEAREFAKLLVDYDKKEFEKLASILFQADDASVRSSLISCLPSVDGKKFLKEIKESMGDADPDVRIASIWALVDFQETKTISQAINMLRDPVERVRIEVARAIAETGSDSALAELKQILFDESEVSSVKIPAIEGLSASKSIASIEILSELLLTSDQYDRETITALAVKTEKKEISRMIEFFKDGSPALRDKLTVVFTRMKEKGEQILLDLLKEDITALKPFICQVLEQTGFIESRIRLLKHRKPDMRRMAARELSFIGTPSSFRGIVLAARDSDKEVRISVTKALEKLNNAEGTEILKSLQEDPDKKVRKYTAWALERLNSRNTE